MSLNSINTNATAYVALQSLNATGSSARPRRRRQISTGYRVADATDDGGAFAVAQTVRSNVGALTSVNQQLGTAKGLVTTALSSLTSISDVLVQAKNTLVKIADQSISSDQRDDYITSYQQLVKQVADNVDNSTYNGETLLGAASGPVSAILQDRHQQRGRRHRDHQRGRRQRIAGHTGGPHRRHVQPQQHRRRHDHDARRQQPHRRQRSPHCRPAAGYATALTSVNNKLNQAGADSNYLDAQVTFNSAKIDSLNSGLGALVDADLSQESALLHVAADQAAARHPGTVDRQPGTTSLAQPVQELSRPPRPRPGSPPLPR